MNYEEVSLKYIDKSNPFFDIYRDHYNGFDNWFSSESQNDEDCLIYWDRNKKDIKAILYASVYYSDHIDLDNGRHFNIEDYIKEVSNKALRIEMFTALSVNMYISMFLNFIPRIKLYQTTDVIYMINNIPDKNLETALEYVGMSKHGTVNGADLWIWSSYNITI